MLNTIKKYPVSFLVGTTILLTFVLSFTIYKQVSLLHFINISFYFSSSYIFLGLLLFVTNKGFFDGISYSFRKMFKSNHPEEDKNDIVPLSELISLSHSKFLTCGILVLSIMLICLWFYY
ncbi:MAG: DUF3899 domain-containing protein [Bacillus sp. (in: firmicutes)]